MDSSILTYTGKLFDVFDPKPENVDIRDIAHALSQLCRFGSHCPRFYSVAEHSVRLVKAVYPRQIKSPSELLSYKYLGMLALLHDSAEAYVGDICRPIKRKIEQFKQIEDRVLSVVFEHFNVPIDYKSDSWKHVLTEDSRLLITELRDLRDYESTNYPDLSPYDNIIVPFSNPQDAERVFLDWASQFGLLESK